MFISQTPLARFYAVRYKDSNMNENMLMQGGKQIKLFRKHSRAESALAKLGFQGEVIDLSLNEVSATKSERLENVSGVTSTLSNIANRIEKNSSVDLYKLSVVTFGGTNVIRYSSLDSVPAREPGDNYLDMEVHMQVRVNY